MAKTRYIGAKVVKPRLDSHTTKRGRLEQPGLTSFPNYPPGLFNSTITITHTVKQGERLDVLARRYLGDGRYWWIICMVNGINDPIGDKRLRPGSELAMSTDAQRVIGIMQQYDQRL